MHMGIAVQLSLLRLKKDEFKPEAVKRKTVRIEKDRKVVSVQSVKIESCKISAHY